MRPLKTCPICNKIIDNKELGCAYFDIEMQKKDKNEDDNQIEKTTNNLIKSRQKKRKRRRLISEFEQENKPEFKYPKINFSKNNETRKESSKNKEKSFFFYVLLPSLISLICLLLIVSQILSSLDLTGSLFSWRKASLIGNQELHNKLLQAPGGLYSYGGPNFFEVPINQGLHQAMSEFYQTNYGYTYELRRNKTYNLDTSYKQGVQRVLDGEVSFAFNGRPLKASEYARAANRGFTLAQEPMALEALIVFGADDIPVSKISLADLQKVFSGEILTWNQLNPLAPKENIIPIVYNLEDLDLIGVKTQSPNMIEIPNITVLSRKVFEKKGSLALVSGGFVKGRQYTTLLSLAYGDTANFVSPFKKDGNFNLNAIKYGKYPLTRQIYLVYRSGSDESQDRDLPAKAYLGFLRLPEGKKFITDSDYVPLN